MKSILITIVFLFFIKLDVLSQIKGIEFKHNTTWKEALLIAKQEEKIIFLDAYTTWCNPCKYMSKHVFTDSKVGEFYNQHFINLKVDMESEEGEKLKELYEITNYPSLLWIDSTGRIVNKHIGMIKKPSVFLQKTKVILDASKSFSFLSQKEFDKGRRDEKFLIQHVKNLLKEQLSADEAVAEFMKLYSPLSLDNENHLMMYCLDLFSNNLYHPLTKVFQENAAKYRQTFPKQLALIRVKSMLIVHNGLRHAVEKESEEELELVLTFIKEYLKDKQPRFIKQKIRSHKKKYRKRVKEKHKKKGYEK